MMKLEVGLGQRSYPILIGGSLLERVPEFAKGRVGKRVAIVTNEVVAPLYLSKMTKAWEAVSIEAIPIVLPDGESMKNWQGLTMIYDRLMSMHADRTTTILALGGGVVGDLAGFAAATYQRGVAYIQIPTTLLAQVDSSVGGKTGINHPLGKNMIGAFWQPVLVVADTDTLTTLPAREFSSGLAEVIKYGLIRDPEFLEWIEVNIDRLMCRDAEAISYAVHHSCANKAAVVAGDEYESALENGRALLNLGHTFGHAIETGEGYGKWLHGEAVAAGMVMAAELSRRLGWLQATDVDRIKRLLIRAKLPVSGPKLGPDRYLDLMRHDKKVMSGRLRLVLLKRLGQAVTWVDASESDIRAAIEACCA